MSMRIVRPAVAQDRLGVGHSKYYKDYVATGRIRHVRLGPKASGVIEDELDALIEQLRAERDAAA